MDENFDLIKSLEIELAGAGRRLDSARLDSLLDLDFMEVGKSGRIYSRAEAIEAVLMKEPIEIEFSAFRFASISANAILVTYRTCCNGNRAYRSSIWRQSEGEWRLLYHQGTGGG